MYDGVVRTAVRVITQMQDQKEEDLIPKQAGVKDLQFPNTAITNPERKLP